MNNIQLTFFLALGAFGVLLFHIGYYPPVLVSVMVFVLVSYLLIVQYQKHFVGPLILLLFLCYALPFIHIIPYLWFDYSSEPLILWGLAVNSYMTDKTIIELMSMIGAVGACGFAVGAIAAAKRFHLPEAALSASVNLPPMRTLSMPTFFVWIAMGVIASWLFAPAQTVFTEVYTESVSISQNWNFSSLWMFSYAFLTFALADAIIECDRSLARLKRKIFFFAMLLVVVWFQLLRGDRESLPLILAAILMFYVWGAPITSFINKKTKVVSISKIKIALLVLLVFLVSLFTGALRYSLVGADLAGTVSIARDLFAPGQIGFENILAGTWSAVLLTPLGIAGDHLNNSLSLQYGQTYWDFIASLMPGFVADFIGYQRPIDGFHGPAWEVTYGMGGNHAVVVPFMNFRMFGVFAIIASWTYLFAKLERLFSADLTPSRLAFLGIVAMGTPHWLWYGEKNIINSLIIWFLLSLIYRASISIHSRKTVTTAKTLLLKTVLRTGI
jgi:hypothetical protein